MQNVYQISEYHHLKLGAAHVGLLELTLEALTLVILEVLVIV